MQQLINVLVPHIAPGAHAHAGAAQTQSPGQGQEAPDGAFQAVLLGMLLAGAAHEGQTAQTAVAADHSARVQPEALSLLPLAEGQTEAPQPAEPMTDPLTAEAAMLAAMSAGAAQVAPLPAGVQAPDPAQTQAQAQSLVTLAALDGADPALEAFVQKAVQAATAQQAPAEAAPAPASAAPGSESPVRFQDLLRLVTGEERPQGNAAAGEPTARAGAALGAAGQAEPTAPAAQARLTSVEGLTQAQPQPQPQAAPAEAATATQSPDAPAGLLDLKPAAPQTVPAASETQAPPPAPPVQPEQVVRQAARFLKVALEGKRSEVKFLLHPEHLGHVAVRLVLQEGTVRANLLAQNQAVKAALEANMEQLRSRLADQGLRVEQIHVAVSGDGASGHSQHSHQREQRHFGQPGGSGNAPWQQRNEDGTETQAQRPASRSQLPGSTGRRINSLA